MGKLTDRERAHQALDVIAAVALEQAGKTDEAIKYYRQAIDREPENGNLKHSLGLVYIKASRIYDALTELKQALMFSPENGECYGTLARCYSVLGWGGMEAIFLRAFLEFGEGGDAAGTARARLHELDVAGTVVPIKEFLKVAREDFDERAKGVMQKSGADESGKLTRKLREDLARYVRAGLVNMWAAPHFAIAADLAQRGKYWGAIAHLISGLQQGPEAQSAILMLASCYAELGLYDRAREVMELVELQRAEADEQQPMREQLEHLRRFISSEGEK